MPAPKPSSALFAALVLVAAAGCNLLLGLPDFTVRDDAGTPVGADAGFDARPDDGGCVDPNGFNGKGCWRCEPTTPEHLLSACTTATFEEFDNAKRIPNFDPADPRPALDPLDAGTVEAGPVSDAGPTNDGGLPECTFTELPNPVVVVGATGYPFDVIARAMGNKASLYVREVSSCVALEAVLIGTTKLVGPVKYYSPTDGSTKTCFVSSGLAADVSPSSLFPETCKATIPNDVADFLGPANPVVFIAPKVASTSAQAAISAEAAYRVYGFGGTKYPVEPWTDENFIFRRTASSGNQNTMAQTLGIPADRFRGTDSLGSSAMRTVVEGSSQPTKTIGISSSEIVDTLAGRGALRTMAYQHFQQPVAFYPDANPTAYDKLNVRDGHYYIWVSLHVYARTTMGGDIVGAQSNLGLGGRDPDAVKNLVLSMTNRREYPNPAADVFSAQKIAGLVPQCAMRVTRDKEGGPLRSFRPNVSCECAFDLANPSGVGRPECKACADASTCPGDRPRCSFGYCEK